MKKLKHPTDDFFREVLKDHHVAPSDEAKKAFLRDAMELPRPGKTRRKGFFFLSGLLLLASAGIFIWAIAFDNVSSNTNRTPDYPAKNSTISSQLDKSAISVHSTDKSQQTTTTITKNKEEKLQLTQTIQEISAKQPANNKIISTAHNRQKQPIQYGGQKPLQQTQKPSSIQEPPAITNSISTESTPQPEPQPEIAVASVAISLPGAISDSSSMILKPDTMVRPASRANEKSQDPRGKSSRWVPSIGVYYTPEWMFNTLEGTKFVNNFGIEGTFHFGRFSVRTGAGLSIAKGTNELTIGYNDFLGAYNKLDSMKFTWNDPAHEFIPTMYMSQQDVWDSLMKLEYPRVVKRYTYLQIPMIMGYEFWQTDRISIGVRLGPVLSVLLASKQLSAAYDPGKKRIVSVNDIAPEQVSLNWQVMAGMNVAITLTESLKIEIEPCARYYFNSVYEKPVNNTKPWSVGLRAAFVVRF